MSDRSTSDWNPQDDSVLQDQRVAYDEMRKRCPVAHSEFLGWSLFRHVDIKEVLGDPQTYSSFSRHRAIPNGLDEPEHTPYRTMLDPYLDAAAIATFEQRCRIIATESIRSILIHDDVDIVTDFTEPFCLKSLCAFLGWPIERWGQLRGWSHGNQAAAFSRDRRAGKSLAAEYSGYVSEALDARRKVGVSPSDDLTSSLMAVQVDGKRLSDEDIVSIFRNWTAGHGTVAAGIGLVIQYLAQHQEVQQRLRSDPTLISTAIDEILRVDGPLVANRRTTSRDVEIDGCRIAAGEKISLMWIAANRDEDAFDVAGEVLLDRDSKGNLLFGWGIHVCQGILLARLEMRVAIEELLTQTNRFELHVTEPPRRDVYPGNGLASMKLKIS